MELESQEVQIPQPKGLDYCSSGNNADMFAQSVYKLRESE